MNTEAPKQRYLELLRSVQHIGAAEGETGQEKRLDEDQLQELEALWVTGQLGHGGTSLEGHQLNIRDHGEWNRQDGPSFLRVEMDIDGRWFNGPIVLTEYAEDWETLGYDRNELYTDVLVQLCLHPPKEKWQSYTSDQRRLLIIPLKKKQWHQALSLPTPLDSSKLKLCKKPLENMSKHALQKLLEAACCYRMALKREHFEQRARALGRSQAWYEAWAEALGYHSNRRQMKILARRVPLSKLTADNAEALLLGTAGFLTASLPEAASCTDRMYHRQVWDKWWSSRDQYQLQGARSIQWQYGSLRPMNHPSRRVAALAYSVEHWEQFESILRADKLKELENYRKGMKHGYWCNHSALPSDETPRYVAMVGKERMRAFLINHLLVNDEQELAWEIYKKQKERSIAGKIRRLAKWVIGEREEIEELLGYCYIQQGLLQVGHDFSVGEGGEYPEELAAWE